MAYSTNSTLSDRLMLPLYFIRMTPSFFRRKQNERKEQKNYLAIQFRARIVPSGSPGQANFLAGQVTLKGFLPNGKGHPVMFKIINYKTRVRTLLPI